MPKRAKTVKADPAASETRRQTGLRIRAIRELAGLTQEELCEALQVDQSTWSKWERGIRPADPFVMARLAARAKASLDLIYRGIPSGTHPILRQMLEVHIPDLLVPSQSDTVQDMDKAQASYRAAIDLKNPA